MFNFDFDFDNYEKKMEHILKQLENKEIPESYPKEISHFDAMMMFTKNPNLTRNHFISISSFALISKDWIKELTPLLRNKKCLEIMAGSGMLAKALFDEGIDIIATDSKEWQYNDVWFDIESLDAISAIKKYGKDMDYIICSWIPYASNIGTQVIQLMRNINPNLKMIYIGEPAGGCCADYSFYDIVEYIENDYIENANKKFKRWSGLYDKIYLIK